MGRMFVERALAAGAAAVVAWDVDADGLTALASADLRGADESRLLTATVDLADPDAIARAASEVIKALGGLDVIINNAGIITGNQLFWEMPKAAIDTTMAVNVGGYLHVAREFLPGMIASGTPARIVNIASAAANTPNPRMSVYAASKAAVALWSESLRVELRRASHKHVAVTTVSPSYVSTGMFAGACGPLLTPIVAPERVVDAVWAAMSDGRPTVMIPRMVGVGKAMHGLLPARSWDAMARLFRVYGSMDHFTGRK